MPEAPKSGQPIRSEFIEDPEMMELVRMFVDEMPERLSDMQNAWREANAEVLGRVAHQLKGASAGYGFPTMGEAAASLEKAVKSVDHDLSAVQKEFEALVDICNRASL